MSIFLFHRERSSREGKAPAALLAEGATRAPEKQISIIFLNYKTRRLLRQCLKGIYRFPPHVTFEIIVVDNGSHDGTDQMMASEFPQVRFIALPKNRGYAAGSNIGIKAATGKYLLFLNADILVLENSINNLYHFIQEHDDVGIAGPQLLNPEGTIQESAYRFHKLLTPIYQRTFLGRTAAGKKEISRFLIRDWDHTSTREVGWLMSSCFIVRAELLKKIGAFDERFFLYLSDTDLCRRVWIARYKVCYTVSSQFIHYHRRQSADDLKVALIHSIDGLKYFWKWRNDRPTD